MGFFKNLISQDLVQDKYKKEWAEKIYDMGEIEELVDKYAAGFDKDARQLFPEIQAGLFTDDNPQMRALIGKVLIEQMIEKIFQLAKKEGPRLKAMGLNRWDTPHGIAYGAINLIKPTDVLEKKLFVFFVAFAVILLNFGVQFNDYGMRQAFKDSGWAEEEIDSLLAGRDRYIARVNIY